MKKSIENLAAITCDAYYALESQMNEVITLVFNDATHEGQVIKFISSIILDNYECIGIYFSDDTDTMVVELADDDSIDLEELSMSAKFSILQLLKIGTYEIADKF